LQRGNRREKFTLLTAEKPLIVMRVPSVAEAVTHQYLALLRAARFPLVAWTLLIGLAAAILGWCARPARKFGKLPVRSPDQTIVTSLSSRIRTDVGSPRSKTAIKQQSRGDT
jgi:hypothetical protein